MGSYKNITLDELYKKLNKIEEKLDYLEDYIIPEEELSEDELKEIETLRQEALKEHKEGKTVKLEDL